MGTDATGARDLGAVVLGLDGFRLVAVDEHDGELELAVETTNDMVGCPGCGAVATAHGRRPVRVRDLPVGGRPTTLIWIKRLGAAATSAARCARGRRPASTSRRERR